MAGEITEPPQQRVTTCNPMYNWPLIAVHHHHNTRQNARLNSVESRTTICEDICVSFNPNSIAHLKRLKRDPRKWVTFAHRLLTNEWPRPTCKNEHLLFHSQDDEYDARDAKLTCREYLQYKIEECQSFINRALAKRKWVNHTRAQRVSSGSTERDNKRAIKIMHFLPAQSPV